VLKLFRLSAKTCAGLDDLRDQLTELAGYHSSGEGNFSARERHLTALSNAQKSLESAVSGVCERLPLELVAEDLRRVQTFLGAITGEVSSDDLLGEIFSNFCIGK
jgi:tRNA modification GTPase